MRGENRGGGEASHAAQRTALRYLFGQVGIFRLPLLVLLSSAAHLAHLRGLILTSPRLEPDDKAAVLKTAARTAIEGTSVTLVV